MAQKKPDWSKMSRHEKLNDLTRSHTSHLEAVLRFRGQDTDQKALLLVNASEIFISTLYRLIESKK